jgi:phospholipase C
MIRPVMTRRGAPAWPRGALTGAWLAGGLAMAAGVAAGCGGNPVERVPGGPAGSYVVPAGIHKIKHVIIVMQENRSFDNYFGTFPGADGIPMENGSPSVCIPRPHASCVRPYHDRADRDGGGPHGAANAIADVDGGKMDGFIAQRDAAARSCGQFGNPACVAGGKRPNVAGYHTAAEIPNYWTYARDFALDDHMFEAVKSWSLPDHLAIVSGWSARCRTRSPMSCKSDINGPYKLRDFDRAVDDELTTGTTSIDLAWTDITWLLHAHHVSWRYYVQAGAEPDCEDDSALACKPVRQSSATLGMWNPLPLFADVHADHQVGNIQDLAAYYSAAKAGRLPSVTWIVPSAADSEHPPASIHQGQAYVTSVINAAMKSRDWRSTAIFLSWDDWGGFYDNVVPPAADRNGYGLRVPGITISPYARHGHIDHQVLSSDAYLKFIEDDFLDGARLNPRTDGRPDSRPDVREDLHRLGNLTADFNFRQRPIKPVLLPVNPPTDSPNIPVYFAAAPPCTGCTTPPPAPASPQHRKSSHHHKRHKKRRHKKHR